MARPKGNKQGSIFFDKNAKKWRAMYYVIDNETKEEKKIIGKMKKDIIKTDGTGEE